MYNGKVQFNNNQAMLRGSVLIVVIWIVLVLASLVIVLAHFIRTEAIAATNYTSLAKAEAVANGGIQYVIAMLESASESTTSYESDQYEAVSVGDGYFWVLKANLSGDKNYEFGPVDEAGKINLNEASLEMMLKLPGMTSELANSIIDWRDEDDQVTTGGAENEYYLLLSEPYQCKNAPLETVEEVLLVKGAGMDILYGEDINRNGILDWNENDGENAPPSDNSNGTLDPGFYNYVTIHSYESNGDGQKINVSKNSNRSQLISLMTEEFGEEKALEIMAPVTLRNFTSLIEFYYFLGIEEEDFAKIIDRLTVTDDEKTVGKININTAPEEVLRCLPGLEQTDVDKLIKERSKSDADTDNILWITEVLDQAKAVAIGSYITSNSFQYSADIVAASSDGRAYCRYYVVIDMAEGTPKIVYKQSLYQSGWPLDPDILESLRNGDEI